MLMAFVLDRHPDLHACVLHVAGDIDLAVVPEIQEVLRTALAAGLFNVVIDLSEVNYADSSALGLLVWLDHELAGTNGKVVLTGANENVSRILEVSGLVSVTPNVCTDESVQQALLSLDVAIPVGDPMWAQSLAVPANVESLAPARERVCTMVEALGFTDAAMFDLKVALGEALANAVRHGSPAGSDEEIYVHVRAYDDRVVLDVVDTGAGFDGAHVCSDDLYASGGRGIMFMRALMDDVRFAPGPSGGTMVTLVKHRSAHRSP